MGQKPNNFAVLGVLTGAEELYSQALDLPKKFTVDTLKDYVEANLTGGTDADWVEVPNKVYNTTDDIGIGVIPSVAQFEVSGNEFHTFSGSFGTLTKEVKNEITHPLFLFADTIRDKVDNGIDEFSEIELAVNFLGDTHIINRSVRAAFFGDIGYFEDKSYNIADEQFTDTTGTIRARILKTTSIFRSDVRGASGSSKKAQVQLTENALTMEYTATNSTNVKIELRQDGSGDAGIKITGLQTGSAGLAAGEVYKDVSGFLKIV